MTTPKNPGRKANGEGTVYQRKDGRWEASGYVLGTDGIRKRISVYGATRKQAMGKLTEKLAHSNKGLLVAGRTGTLGAYLDHWLDTVARHTLRSNTFDRYQAVVRLYIKPYLGNKNLTALTARDVRTWLARVRETCQCCHQGIDARRAPAKKNPGNKPRCCAIGQCCHKTLSEMTVQYLRTVLNSALQHAVREDELPRNVARNIKMPTARSQTFEPLTPEEARKLLTACANHPHGALIELTLRTGLRKSEVLGLRWSDLNLETGTLTVAQTLQRTKNGLVIAPTKTYRSLRRVALPRQCTTTLTAHREQQDKDRAAAGDHWQENGLVFTNPWGRALDPVNLLRRFHTLCDHAGIRRIRFHDLRHSCATLLLEQGVELVTIKELLGHANIGVTGNTYAHVRLRLQHDAIEAMNTALQPDHQEDDDNPTPDGSDEHQNE
jgi:integrase